MPIVDDIKVGGMNQQPRRKTHVMLLLDETGSMSDIRQETIKGVNEYIQSLRVDKGDDVLFTLVKFDSNHYTPMYSATPIKDVKNLTDADYSPCAMTNLYDSIGRLITTADEGSADVILCTIMTDGEENYSREYKLTDIKKLIDQKQAQSNPWVFTFLGADINAYQASQGMGIAASNTASYGKYNTGGTYQAMASSTGRLRASNVVGSLQRGSDGYIETFSAEEKARIEKDVENNE